jgi:hypothetical protein
MTIASAQTMAVPAGVTLTQQTDFARNAIKLTATYEDREASAYITNEMLRRMDRSAFQEAIDTLVASVMAQPKPELIVMNSGMPEQDLPGGLVNYPVLFMGEGDYVGFEHPDWPDEHFLVRFLYSRGPWTEVRLEWPGHGNVTMPAVRGANMLVRDVIAEAQAMVSVLMETRLNG